MAIKTCKECGKEVSTSAKQCPHCGKQHPTGGTSVGAIIVVALIVLIGIGQFPRSPSSSSTAAAENATQSDATPAVTEPVVAVSAAQLFADYQANEVAADNQYKGRMLRVSGVVQSINKDVMDNTYLTLETSNPFMMIHAGLAKEVAASAASLSRGQKITLVCKGKGMIVGSPMLDDCTP